MQRDATLLKLAVITRVVKDDSWGCRTGAGSVTKVTSPACSHF